MMQINNNIGVNNTYGIMTEVAVEYWNNNREEAEKALTGFLDKALAHEGLKRIDNAQFAEWGYLWKRVIGEGDNAIIDRMSVSRNDPDATHLDVATFCHFEFDRKTNEK